MAIPKSGGKYRKIKPGETRIGPHGTKVRAEYVASKTAKSGKALRFKKLALPSGGAEAKIAHKLPSATNPSKIGLPGASSNPPASGGGASGSSGRSKSKGGGGFLPSASPSSHPSSHSLIPAQRPSPTTSRDQRKYSPKQQAARDAKARKIVARRKIDRINARDQREKAKRDFYSAKNQINELHKVFNKYYSAPGKALNYLKEKAAELNPLKNFDSPLTHAGRSGGGASGNKFTKFEKNNSRYYSVGRVGKERTTSRKGGSYRHEQSGKPKYNYKTRTEMFRSGNRTPT